MTTTKKNTAFQNTKNTSPEVAKWNVPSATRIDLFLREHIPSLLQSKEHVQGIEIECGSVQKADAIVSNSKIRRLIMAGVVMVNGRQCRIPAYDLHAGDEVTVTLDKEKFFFEKQPDDIHFEVSAESVLFEDESIIVVNKPAFFPTEETITGNRDNLHEAIIRYLWAKNPALRNPPYVGIMHRLDRETSGVILFTKTRAVNKNVFDMFEKHTAHKVYRAVCTRSNGANKFSTSEVQKDFFCDKAIGRMSASSAQCKMDVVAGKNGSPRTAGSLKDVQEAYTEFSLVGKKDNRYFIEARPRTGRTHQIRVHLASLGLPILGDELYGGEQWNRILLHAQSLTFPHPVSGEVMCVEAPLPDEFKM